MNNGHLSIKQSLTGAFAFYDQVNYQQMTRKEMDCSKPLNNSTYIYNTQNNTEDKIWHLSKKIFSFNNLYITFYRCIHSLVGKLIIPASSKVITRYMLGKDHLNDIRKKVDLSGEWKFKTIAIQVDGCTIDAVIMGKASTLANGRWVLVSNGNAEFYEHKLEDNSFRDLISNLNGNAIVFNYPGAGRSSGSSNRDTLIKVYCAMLKFLEDQAEGIGAKEIIGYGHSIGGAVQAEALLVHELKPNLKYVFVKSRTFSDLQTTVSCLMNKYLGFLVKILGWNMDSVESSKKLKAPEIIMQTSCGPLFADISERPHIIQHDGVIPAEVSLANKLLDHRHEFVGKKCFMGIFEGHNHGLILLTRNHLISKINTMLEAF